MDEADWNLISLAQEMVMVKYQKRIGKMCMAKRKHGFLHDVPLIGCLIISLTVLTS